MFAGRITLYHGTHHLYADVIREYGIKVDLSSRAMDFGPGFYMTSNREQAVLWAKSRSERRFLPVPPEVVPLLAGIGITETEFIDRVKQPRLVAVSFDWDELTKRFPGKILTKDAEWQQFVHRFRNNISLRHPYAWVLGPVADGGLTGPADGIDAYHDYDQISFHQADVARFLQKEGVRFEEP